MREPIDSMHDRIMHVLEKAGRNKQQLARELTKLEVEIRNQIGEKSTEWTEEYYHYLLDLYAQALGLAISTAVEADEFEWAGVLTARKTAVADRLNAVTELV
jgi:hypothetical protein